MTTESIEDYMSLDAEYLYELLGKKLISQQLAAKPRNTKELIHIAKRWISQNKGMLSEKICDNSVVREYIESPKKQRRALVISAVIDSIQSSLGALALFTAVLLVMHEGLDSICVDQ